MVKNTHMCNDCAATNISFRVSSKELEELDACWRADMHYKNRADYIREKLGFNRRVEKL